MNRALALTLAATDGGNIIGTIVVVVAILFIACVFVANIKIVPQARARVVERLGTYLSTWNTGMHFKIPFFDKVSRQMSLKEQVVDFAPQPVITKDNVTMRIDTVIYFQITDPKLYTYGVEYPIQAIELLTITTLRNIVGDLELDETLTSRDTINSKMRQIIDEATDPWGIKVNRVELKSITPPGEIQDAMEKQMKAEREKRQSILRAEGEKASAILVAEGQRQSMILQAEARKQSAILAAEAVKEAKVREAEGEAEAIERVQTAIAVGIAKINDAQPSQAALLLQSYDTLAKVANGQATKIVIPSDLQGLAGLTTVIKQLTTNS
ncbi:MAG: SPFH/Band 7/PHB domain protein [Oscillospiraceae bacterium]|jgi:regulator of protease activity HflC (stomatin/prohibitin superfamily)|nr:SPFH/Band 7/PHB domain protein [Oscillospiraceae bacterium]